MIDGGVSCPFLGGATFGLLALGSIRKHAEQAWGASLRIATLHGLYQLRSPGSCLVWVSVLTSSIDELQCGNQAKQTLSFPTCSWSWYFIAVIGTLRHQASTLGAEISYWCPADWMIMCEYVCMCLCVYFHLNSLYILDTDFLSNG